MQGSTYEFGPFRLDPSKRLLQRAGVNIAISPKGFDALLVLIEHRDRVVHKDELAAALWPDVAVQDSSLTQLIFLLRKALHSDGDGGEYIVTASRYGYRFVATVTVISSTPPAHPLDDAVRQPAVSTQVPQPTRSAGREWPFARRPALGWAVVLLMIAATALSAVFVYRHPTPADTHPIRVFIRPPENALPSVDDDVESPPIVSRDGRQVAFVARTLDGRTLLWVRALDTLLAQPLSGTEDAMPWSPFWSPDGRSLAFVVAGALERVDIAGGAVQTLVHGARASRGSWNADGTILFSRERGLYRVPATGGIPVLVLRPTGDEEVFTDAIFLPDGRHFVFLAERDALNVTAREIRVGALDSKEAQTLLSGSDLSAAQYASPFLVFLRGGRLQAQRFDTVTLKLDAEALSAPEQVSYSRRLGFAAMSVSDSGLLVYRTGPPTVSFLTWFDRAGNILERVNTPPGRIFNYHLSPDGRHVSALIQATSATGEELWLLNLAGGPSQRLPYAPGHVAGAVWSPDSSHIAFLLDDGGHEGAALMRQAVTSPTAPEPLLRSPHFEGVSDWSRDGRFLLFQLEGADEGSHIWALPLSSDHRPISVVNTGREDRQGQLSPDGVWVAYRSNESGRNEVYVKRFGVDSPAWKISPNGGNSPRWRRDGGELYYLQSDRSLMAVQLGEVGGELRTEGPQRLFDVHARICGCFNFAPSADGRRFLVNAFPNSSESQPLVVVLNWTADLARSPQ